MLFKITDSVKIMFTSRRGITPLIEKGGSVSATLILHNCRHYVSSLSSIIDVGANQGQFAVAASHYYPGADIHSFEPLPSVYQTLQRNTRKYPLINTYNFALGSSTGNLAFNSNTYSHASSILNVSALQKNILPKTANYEQIQVPVRRLDDVLPQITVNGPILLKLDVQGFEKEVLKGAVLSLRQIDYLLFESSFVQMYDGEPLFDEMHSYVKDLGFEFIAPVGFFQSKNLQILQMDLLYKRTTV